MKGAWVETSRAEQVREAAKGWKQAGAIDAGTLSAIEADYPDPRMQLHRAWRVLVFVLATVAILALFWTFFGRSRGLLVSGLISAAALALATELLRSSRLSGTGADAATSFWALVFLLVGVETFFSDTLHLAGEDALTAGLAAAAVAGALAAWRWGFWFEAGIGAAALYLLLGRWAGGRAAWFAVGALAMALAYRRLDRASLSPAHRRGLAAAFVVSAAALYAALNLYSYDEQLVEKIHLPLFSGRQPAVSPAAVFRPLCALATAALPALGFAWGIRARLTLLLAIGIVASALSVATLRHYVPIGPRWAFLTVCGAVLVGAALWIYRRLRDAPGGAWRGLTGSPLYSGADGGVSPLSALGAHLAAPGAPPEDRGGLTPGGGEFGGGGASGQY